MTQRWPEGWEPFAGRLLCGRASFPQSGVRPALPAPPRVHGPRFDRSGSTSSSGLLGASASGRECEPSRPFVTPSPIDLRESGRDVVALQALMRHSLSDTTQGYTDEVELDELAEPLGCAARGRRITSVAPRGNGGRGTLRGPRNQEAEAAGIQPASAELGTLACAQPFEDRVTVGREQSCDRDFASPLEPDDSSRRVGAERLLSSAAERRPNSPVIQPRNSVGRAASRNAQRPNAQRGDIDGA
jgi:hypothetical protein